MSKQCTNLSTLLLKHQTIVYYNFRHKISCGRMRISQEEKRIGVDKIKLTSFKYVRGVC